MAEVEASTEEQNAQSCPQLDSAGGFVAGWLTFVVAFLLAGFMTTPPVETSFLALMGQIFLAGLVGGMIFKGVAMCVNVLAQAMYFRKDT